MDYRMNFNTNETTDYRMVKSGEGSIPLSFKELLYLDVSAIEELAKKPRPEDSMIIPKEIPEAVEWFREVYESVETEQKKKAKLLESMLVDGWQIPEYLRNLLWRKLSINAGLEACRIIARFYSAIKANENEIWHHIEIWGRRNAYKDYKKLKAIITFAIENPQFGGCEHELLKRFCPAGKCFIAELINEYEKPHLFEQV